MKDSRDLMTIYLVSDSEQVLSQVRQHILPPHQLVVHTFVGLLKEDYTLSSVGEELINKVKYADVLLIDWNFEAAPIINLLCYKVRMGAGLERTFLPVIALTGDGQEEIIAALASGADGVATLPIHISLLQAYVTAHHRLADTVRRATVERLKAKINQKRKHAAMHAHERPQAPVHHILPALPEGTEQSMDATERHSSPETEAAHNINSGITSHDLDHTLEHELILFENSDSLQIGELRLDNKAYRFYVGSGEIELMPKEFALIKYLMKHAGEACTRDQILDEVWGIDFDTGTNMVDVYMHFVRKKLEAHGLKGIIKTIRGLGYRLDYTPANTETRGTVT